MKIRAISMESGQRGWIAYIHYTVETPRQFTAEEHTATVYRSDGRVGLLGALHVAWLAVRAARAEARALAAEPGPWETVRGLRVPRRHAARGGER